MSDVVLVGRAQRITAASPGVSWLLALAPEPGEPWLDAFADHPWEGPLPLRLQPPCIVSVHGITGVGLHSAHVDGSFAPYAQVHASVEAAVHRANAIAAGRAAPTRRNAAAERAVRRMLQQPLPAQRPPRGAGGAGPAA